MRFEIVSFYNTLYLIICVAVEAIIANVGIIILVKILTIANVFQSHEGLKIK